MTETNPKTEEITEITEVVTASEALKPTEKIKKPPSQSKLDALERARAARSQKAKEKRETLLKAALIIDKAAQPAPSEPLPAKDLNYFLEVHKEGLTAFPEYENLVKPPTPTPEPARRPIQGIERLLDRN